MLTQALAETCRVRVTLPPIAGAPIESPKSFRRASEFGLFSQSYIWHPATRTVEMVLELAIPQRRVTPAEFLPFRELAQDVLQQQRNRLIVPLGTTAGAPAGPTWSAP